MMHRERRVAQIVRDFMDAYVLFGEIGERLRAGNLEFSWIKRLVAESDEQSALYRLKEECHALFRSGAQRGDEDDLQAEELFDLAVGALFHESMKFREGYYLTITYGPKLERIVQEGAASGPLVEAFRRVIEAGRTRMLESELEVAELFDETRDQLLVLLKNMSGSGAIARVLVASPALTEQVFGVPNAALLETIFGSTGAGYRLAIENLVGSGHFGEAVRLFRRGDVQAAEAELCGVGLSFALGMQHFYEGDSTRAVQLLSDWVEAGAQGPDSWRAGAVGVLGLITDLKAEVDPELSDCARAASGSRAIRRSQRPWRSGRPAVPG